MKRLIIPAFVFVMALFTITSCTTKRGAISQLEKFSYELRDNGRYYSFKDWENAAEKFSDIRKNLNKHNYTGEQRHYIGELQGKCAGYVFQGLKGRIKDYGEELNGMLEGLMEIIDYKF